MATIDASAPAPNAEVHQESAPQGGTIDWRTSIPADLRSEKSLENIKDIPSLVKGYVEAQRYIGGAVRIPGEKATPEEIKAFQAKLGVPEKRDDYKIARPILPDHVGWDDEAHSKVLEIAHTAGLTKTQATKIVEGLSGFMVTQAKDPQVILAESRAKLESDWGDNFSRNIILASKGAEHLGGQELLDALQETGAGMHPVIVKALSKFGSGLLEQGLIKSEDTRLETVQDAQSQIDKIRAAGLTHPYFDAAHPGHAAAVEEYRRLMQLIDANK